MLFPEHLLTEGILVITLLKVGLSAAFFAACVQYIYRRRDICVPIMAVMYALMMYMLAYSWNIMWLDCVMVLPLVVMFFEKMMRTGKILGYVLSLAYALYANYYIGFMLCVFLVLYYIAYVLRERRSMEKQAYGVLRFIGASALGGGLVMFLMVPVYLGLGHTSAVNEAFPKLLGSNFDLFNLLGRHLFATSPTIRSGNLPNIYCGVLSVLLLPLFATTKSIPLRRRLTYLGLLFVLALSFSLNYPNLIWHGLHSPNDLPYRFSFIYSFVLLLIGYEVLLQLRHVSFKQIGFSFVGIMAYLMLEERFGDEAYDVKSIYFSLFFIAIYAVILSVVVRRKQLLRPAYSALLLVVVLEMVLNGGSTYLKLNDNEHFTPHLSYVDNDTTEAIRQAVDRAKEKGDAELAGDFYRLELAPRRTFVDTALFDYRGITLFASSNLL